MPQKRPFQTITLADDAREALERAEATSGDMPQADLERVLLMKHEADILSARVTKALLND